MLILKPWRCEEKSCSILNFTYTHLWTQASEGACAENWASAGNMMMIMILVIMMIMIMIFVNIIIYNNIMIMVMEILFSYLLSWLGVVEELKYMTENVYPLDISSFNHFQSLLMGPKRKTATNSFLRAFTPDKGFYSWYWYFFFKGEPYPGAKGAAGGALWTEVSFEWFVKMQTIKILFFGG